MSQVNIQFTLFSAFYSPLIITMSENFLKEEGLDYQWSVAAVGTSAVDAIIDGSADIIQSAPIQGVTALERGEIPPAVHFAQINEMDGFFITARDTDANFDWKKLEGAEVVMFKGGQPNAMFRYACHKAGIDFSKIIAITPGGAADIDRTFREGTGQYVQQQGPFPQQLEHDSIGHIVARCGPQIGRCAFSSLAASREWLTTDEAKAFMRAYRKARLYLNEANATEITRSLSSWFPNTEDSALAACIDDYQKLGCWTPHTEITRDAFEVSLDVFEHAKMISKRHNYDDVCTLPPL